MQRGSDAAAGLLAVASMVLELLVAPRWALGCFCGGDAAIRLVGLRVVAVGD